MLVGVERIDALLKDEINRLSAAKALLMGTPRKITPRKASTSRMPYGAQQVVLLPPRSVSSPSSGLPSSVIYRGRKERSKVSK
jgi:hypothetical protein